MTDEQVLAEKVYGCWHEPHPYWWTDLVPSGANCRKCGSASDNPTFTTSAELWNLLGYMMGREDWRRFYTDMWDKYTMEQRAWTAYGYIPWLLTATYQDKGKEKLLFVKLAADWVRTKI